MAKAIMDEKVEVSTSQAETEEGDVPATPGQGEGGSPADGRLPLQLKRKSKCRDQRARLQFAQLI